MNCNKAKKKKWISTNWKIMILSSGLLLVSMISGFSQKSQKRYDMNDNCYEISDIINKKDFEKIAEFILTNGDRQTYCNMYNNNPHYNYESINIYLNPISQKINLFCADSYNVSDYNCIVIQDKNSTYLYYHIKLQKNSVYIYNVYDNELESYKNDIVNEYIPILKSLIKYDEKEK